MFKMNSNIFTSIVILIIFLTSTGCTRKTDATTQNELIASVQKLASKANEKDRETVLQAISFLKQQRDNIKLYSRATADSLGYHPKDIVAHFDNLDLNEFISKYQHVKDSVLRLKHDNHVFKYKKLSAKKKYCDSITPILSSIQTKAYIVTDTVNKKSVLSLSVSNYSSIMPQMLRLHINLNNSNDKEAICSFNYDVRLENPLPENTTDHITINPAEGIKCWPQFINDPNCYSTAQTIMAFASGKQYDFLEFTEEEEQLLRYLDSVLFIVNK